MGHSDKLLRAVEEWLLLIRDVGRKTMDQAGTYMIVKWTLLWYNICNMTKITE